MKRLLGGFTYFCLQKKAYKDYIFRMNLEDMTLSVKKLEGDKKFSSVPDCMRLHKSWGPPNIGEEIHDYYFLTLKKQPLVLEIKGIGGRADFKHKLFTRVEYEAEKRINNSP